MNTYTLKYKKVVDRLIKKSFPRLRGKVTVVEVPRFFPFLSFSQKGFSKYYIFINTKRRKAPINSLKGQLAHELCHTVLDHKEKSTIGDLFHNLRKYISSVFNTKFSRKIEVVIDRETIKRGFVKELYAQGLDWKKTFSDKFVRTIYSRGYMTPKQIKSYAKKIEKW